MVGAGGKKVCENCRFWNDLEVTDWDEKNNPPPEGDPNFGRIGQCRIGRPKVGSDVATMAEADAIWPLRAPTDWCGEFEQKFRKP